MVLNSFRAASQSIFVEFYSNLLVLVQNALPDVNDEIQCPSRIRPITHRGMFIPYYRVPSMHCYTASALDTPLNTNPSCQN